MVSNEKLNMVPGSRSATSSNFTSHSNILIDTIALFLGPAQLFITCSTERGESLAHDIMWVD